MPKKLQKIPKKSSAEKCQTNWDFIVLVLLSAHAARVGVSRMLDSFQGLGISTLNVIFFQLNTFF